MWRECLSPHRVTFCLLSFQPWKQWQISILNALFLHSVAMEENLMKLLHLWRCAPVWHTTQCTPTLTLHPSAFHALVNCTTMHT